MDTILTPEILTVEQAAELLQANRTTVMDYCRDGRIPARKVGPSWRISRAALMAWVAIGQNTEPVPQTAQSKTRIPASVRNNPFYQEGALA